MNKPNSYNVLCRIGQRNFRVRFEIISYVNDYTCRAVVEPYHPFNDDPKRLDEMTSVPVKGMTGNTCLMID